VLEPDLGVVDQILLGQVPEDQIPNDNGTIRRRYDSHLETIGEFATIRPSRHRGL
jgi:hypothetical protein